MQNGIHPRWNFPSFYRVISKLLWSVAVLLLGIGAIAPALCAQTTGTGALSGAIVDPSGAAVGGAQVKATNEATGEVRVGTSTSAGTYVLTLLQPGLYELEISKQGFKLVH